MNINSRQINEIRANCKLYDLDNYFGKDWIESQLKKTKMPALFHILSSEDVCKELTHNLDVLSSFYRYKPIINKLKRENDLNNLQSFITEIEVLAFYFPKYGASLEYETAVKVNGNTRKPDIKLKIDNEEIIIEIRTIFEDAKDKKINDLTDKIREKVLESRLPFAFDLIYNDVISYDDFEIIENFIDELLMNSQLSNGETYKCEIDDYCLFEVYLTRINSNNGHVKSIIHPVRIREDAGRLKNIISDKIDRQLPKNSKNVVIVKGRPSSFIDEKDAKDAFYGRLVLARPKNSTKSQFMHEQNGIIHQKNADKISLLILYTDNFSNRILLLNPTAANTIDELIAKKL